MGKSQAIMDAVNGTEEYKVSAEGTKGTDVPLPPEPMPLMREQPPGAIYPVEALGPVLGPAAKAIAECVQAPAEVAGQSVLAAAAFATQSIANVGMDGRESPCSLYCLSIMHSGGRKSHVDKLATKPLSEFQEHLSQLCLEDLQRNKAELAAYVKVEKAILKKDNLSQEETAKEIQKLTVPKPAEQPQIIVREPTLEAIQKGFRYGRPSQGLFSDEGGQFFGGHAMSKDNLLKSCAGLSDLWGGAPIIRTRSTDGESFALYGRRMSIHLMVQPIVAESVLSDPLMNGQGFMARFLVCWPTPIDGTRLYECKDATKEPAINTYHQRIAELLERPLDLKEGGGLNLRLLVPDGEAKKVWIKCYNAIEKELAPHGELVGTREVANKAGENMLRIAGVLTLVDNPEAGVIGKTQMNQAAQLMSFYLSEAQRLQGVAEVDQKLHRAQNLLDWIHEKNLTHVTLTYIYKNSPPSISARSAKAAQLLVDVLVEHGWLNPIQEGLVVNGKLVQKAWRVRHV